MRCFSSILILLFFFSTSLTAQYVIKIIHPYLLIDKEVGELNDLSFVFRKNNHKNDMIGVIEIVKFYNGKTAAKILKENKKIRVGDFVKIKKIRKKKTTKSIRP